MIGEVCINRARLCNSKTFNQLIHWIVWWKHKHISDVLVIIRLSFSLFKWKRSKTKKYCQWWFNIYAFTDIDAHGASAGSSQYFISWGISGITCSKETFLCKKVSQKLIKCLNTHQPIGKNDIMIQNYFLRLLCTKYCILF